jgi:DNA (cytosine-5)-methyltransferase 1
VITGVSLFAGVGGFDLAMTRLGVKVVASVEIDKHCNQVLAKHFPDSKQFTDIKKVTGKDLLDAGFNPTTGIITGGFPCQDLSVAGKRAGLAGARSGLFWEICRILDETRAKTFILENVTGLLSSNNGRDMAVVVEALVKLGYSIAWRVLDAQYFGVPQRRKRVFIVGCLGNSGRTPKEILSIGFNYKGNNNKNTDKKESITQTSNECSYYSMHGGMINREEKNGPSGSGFFDNEKPSYTLTASNLAIHCVVISSPPSVRKLTPLEYERLQGFPDNWTEGQADIHRYKQMGNAVAVPVVEWILKGIVDML